MNWDWLKTRTAKAAVGVILTAAAGWAAGQMSAAQAAAFGLMGLAAIFQRLATGNTGNIEKNANPEIGVPGGK
jgi:hypothetical protein